ncbi:MAG: hypothetical protein NTV79_02430, partial [Candidatus Aureabacteria bacterium]|nr:hypothetical protein [Candidatus Auribacterota bacterium]
MKASAHLRSFPAAVLSLLLLFPRAGFGADPFDPSPFLGKKWFGIYLMGKKIGYGFSSLERIERRAAPAFRAAMEMTLKVALGGAAETTRIEEERIFSADGEFVAFSSANTVGLGPSPARGEREGGGFRLTLPAGSSLVPAPPETLTDYLAENLLVRRRAAAGDAVRVTLFDTTLLKPLAVSYRVEKIEEDYLSGVPTRVYVIRSEIPELGISSLDRIDENLTVLEAKIAGFLTLREEGEKEARNLSYLSDILTLTALAPRRAIPSPAETERLVLALEGVADGALLSFPPRQTIAPAGPQSYYLTVEKPRAGPDGAPVLPVAGPAFAPYLSPTAEIQSDDPAIAALARTIAGEEINSYRVTEKMTAWVFHNLEKTYRAAIPNAREVLRQKSGDCKAHSVLLA